MRNEMMMLAVASLAGAAQAWNLSEAYWLRNPTFEVNTSNPDSLRGPIADGIRTIAGAGGKYYPVLGGTTGRDCAAGDSWFSDDDDGHNVIDWWDRCNENSHWNIDCYSSTAAGNFKVDLYNGTYEIAEDDIVVCSNKSYWTVNRDYIAGRRYYRRTITHELGHAMGLDHNNPSGVVPTMMDGADALQTAQGVTLHSDDVGGLRARGSCNASDWTLVTNGGNQVSLSGRAGCGLNLVLKTAGSATGSWTPPVVVRNARLGGWVYRMDHTGVALPTTFLAWEELDRNHSLVVTALVVGADGRERELNFARNASNWWPNAGWVSMPENPSSYGAQVSIRRDLTRDHLAEYGVKPLYVKEMQVKHFAFTGWAANVDHGGYVQNLRIER